MKKVFVAAAALALCTGLLAGCGEKSSGERIDGGLADSLPIDLEFSSGAGAWGTGLTLEELSSDYEQGKEWVEDGVRYVSSEPYGVEQGKDFILYLPDTPTDGLNEEFLSWWPGQYQEDQPDTLDFYGLYNVDMGYGFFG